MKADDFLDSARAFARIDWDVRRYLPTEEARSVNSDITREEINAKLEATEARMDARVAGMSAKLDVALAEMQADREVNNVRFASMAGDIGEIKRELSDTHSRLDARFRTVIGNVWGAAVITITLVGATLAIAISSFDSGRETSKSIAEATAQMKQLQMQLEAQAKTAASAPQAAPANPFADLIEEAQRKKAQDQ